MTLPLSPLDLTILLAYLLAAVGLGLWLGRGQRDIGEYLLGGRNLPWWAVLGSIVATETSTATFLSVPGLAFAAGGDLTFLQLALGYIIGRVAVVVLFLPRYFEGTLFTSYEVLHRRFGGATKQTASLMFLVTRNAADGLRLYLAAIALEKAVGIPLTQSVIIMGVVTILYTVFGGMKSVVWNDCIQFVVYIAGALLAAWVIINGLPGGLEQITTFATQHGKFTLFNVSLDPTEPYTIWAGIIGGAFLTLGTHGTDQLMVQRYLSARSRRDAARAVLASGFVVLAQFALFLFIGVGLAAWYAEFPLPEPIEKGDEAFAEFIVAELPPGAVGLVLAAVFSAAMSTLSSSLNSSATAAVNDLYRPWRERREMRDKRREVRDEGREPDSTAGGIHGPTGSRLSTLDSRLADRHLMWVSRA
ncbi:MAG: sodium:solute symporter family transporter, partial [Planctomycetaceae bacterium]